MPIVSIPQYWLRFAGKISNTTAKNGQKTPAENIECFIFNMEQAFIAAYILLDETRLGILNTCLEDDAKI